MLLSVLEREARIIMVELSIIIPVYNVEQYLQECLDSALNIKKISKEIIIIDDGSTDDSSKIINEYENSYPSELIVKTQKNKGLSAARNVGLQLASGSYVMFLDSDDTLDHNAVEKLYHYARSNNLDLLQGIATKFGDVVSTQLPIPKEVITLKECKGTSLLNTYCDFSSIKNTDFRPEVWLMILKRELFVINKLVFTEGMIYEDELMTLTFLLTAKNAKSVDVPFYNYRIRQGSITGSHSDKHVASKAKLVKEYSQLLLKHNFYHQFLSCRVIGWSKEGQSYLSLKDLLMLLTLRKYKAKDLILLCSLIIRKIIRFGSHKSIDNVLNKIN